MKVGLVLPMFSGDAERVLAFARSAEELGFDGVFAFDHLFPPGAPADRPSLEAFTTLSAVAVATRTVAIGTLVTRASLRNAGLIAKLAATVDDVSGGGRMILGIGTGDPLDRPEHDVFGLPYLEKAERREHLVETVRAVRALFHGNGWEGGRHVPSMPGPLLPRPATPGGPPLWVGGFADAVVRLAGREADAWNGWGMGANEFGRKARLLRDEALAAGREASPTWAGILVVGRDDEEVVRRMRARAERGLETDVWGGTVRELVEWFLVLEELGATWAVVVPGGTDQVELIAEEVIPHVGSGG
jgi:alkanesulfonate monooxygenase SsuD/methylene tetrahydromethanopterin reductase-like flavin-dependent oxidoreductase (luciferase family)